MQKANHFFWRAGFGPTPSMLCQSSKFNANIFFDAMWTASQLQYNSLQVVNNISEGLMNGLGEAGRLQNMTQEERREKVQKELVQKREEIKNLNLLWLDEMVHSHAQLREKMSLFWHGHFACRNLNSFYQQQLLEVIRKNALGNFADLLREVSQTPAMLQFLNNQQNRKGSPNENFAREVMELFTMGRGNYGENDIKEAARAFTGWGFNLQGQFVFRAFQHDEGQKTILGKTGNFNGDDVLDILLEQRETAAFITRKIYKFFVSDTEPNDTIVAKLANTFYTNNYDLKPLLKEIFTADWFYDERIATPKIKSPIEFLVGVRRILSLQLDNPASQLLMQRNLGQVLFYPPNVAGWPGGKNWIDGNSLVLRMKIGQLAGMSQPLNIDTKDDDDVDMGMRKNQRNGNQVVAKADWVKLEKALAEGKLNDYRSIAAELLQSRKLPDPNTVLNHLPANEAWPEKLKLISTLMATPEYQLC